MASVFGLNLRQALGKKGNVGQAPTMLRGVHSRTVAITLCVTRQGAREAVSISSCKQGVTPL
jgi:hypothetical protein